MDEITEEIKTEEPATPDLSEIMAELELQKKLNAELNQRLIDMKKDSIINTALIGAGAKNIRAVRALLDLNRISFDENSNMTGLSEQLELLKNSEDSDFLFKNELLHLEGAEVLENLSENTVPQDFRAVNLTKQSSLFKSDPSMARKFTRSLFGK